MREFGFDPEDAETFIFLSVRAPGIDLQADEDADDHNLKLYSHGGPVLVSMGRSHPAKYHSRIFSRVTPAS